MNLTKKIIATLTFAFLMILTLQAQPTRGEGGRRGGDPTERANRQSERMIEQLDLSAAQGEKIKTANLKFAEKMKTMRTEIMESGEGREGMRAKMKALREEQKTELKKYLTAEQVEKWEKIEAERPKRGPREGRRGKKKEQKS